MKGEATTETGIKYCYATGYTFPCDKNDVKLKIITKMPKSYCYSALNEVGEHFDNVVFPAMISPFNPNKFYFTKNGVGEVIAFNKGYDYKEDYPHNTPLLIHKTATQNVYVSGGVSRKIEHIKATFEEAKHINY